MMIPGRLAMLFRDVTGAVIIETAVVIPVLALLSLGGFEVSSIVARQSELQSAAAEAAAIALAAKPDTDEKIATVKSVIETSTGLPADNVTLTTVYRCQGMEGFYPSTTSCTPDTVAWRYLQIDMTDTYTPLWTQFGVGSPLDFNVSRAVLVAS